MALPTVFVSHSSKDRAFVENELLPLLRRYKITAWYSKDDIPSATIWEKKIRDGLKSCEWFLVVMSPDAIDSQWVQTEVQWAIERRAEKIVPVLARECDPSDLNLQLIRYQHIDFSQDLESSRAKLLDVWGITTDDSPKMQVRVRIQKINTQMENTDALKNYVSDKNTLHRQPKFNEGEHLLKIDDFATVGRSADSDLCLPCSLISRKHAAFRVRQEGDKKELWIFNLGTNGTLVNGVHVSDSEIQPGDVIEIGEYGITILEISG